MLGSLPLSLVVDGKVERCAGARHLNLVFELIENLSQRVREGGKGGHVDSRVPRDRA